MIARRHFFLLCLASLELILFVIFALPVQAQPAAYSYTAPAGWTTVERDGALLLAPPSEPAGSAFLLVLPVQAQPVDFDAQFKLNLKKFESDMGLTLVRSQTPQRGSSSGAEFSIWYAAYSSAQGNLALAYLARAELGAMGTAVFVAQPAERFDRLIGSALGMLNTLRLTPAAANLVTKATPSTKSTATAQPPVSATGRVSASALNGRLLNLGRGIDLDMLQGIWVYDTVKRDFRVSFGTKAGPFGTRQDTMSTSMTTMAGGGGTYLKIEPDGHYSYVYDYTDGNCHSSQSHQGTAALQGPLLVLQPSKSQESSHRLTAVAPRSCTDYDRSGSLATRRFKAELNETTTVYGFPTYRLSLTNADVAEAIKSFDRLQPRPLPEAAPMMPNSYSTNQTPSPAMQGVWLAASDGAAPQAADFLSEDKQFDDRRYRAALRLLDGGRYELVVRRPDVLNAPICMRDLTLVERGEVRLAYSPSQPNAGNLVLLPSTSRLNDRITHCGADSGQRVADLPLAPRHLFWQFTSGRGSGDKLSLLCGDWRDRWAAWRFLSCPQDAAQLYGGAYTRQ